MGRVWRRERYAVSLLCTICNPVAREQQRERDTKEQIERGGRFDGRFVYVPCAAPEKDEREAGEPAGEDEKPAALVVVAPPPHDKFARQKEVFFQRNGILDSKGGGRGTSTQHPTYCNRYCNSGRTWCSYYFSVHRLCVCVRTILHFAYAYV